MNEACDKINVLTESKRTVCVTPTKPPRPVDLREMDTNLRVGVQLCQNGFSLPSEKETIKGKNLLPNTFLFLVDPFSE